MSRQTLLQETSTRKKLDQILRNLGWVIDEENKNCNVTTELPKLTSQRKKLGKSRGDYFLYKSGTDEIVAILEAKRPGESIKKALKQAIDYANCLDVKIVFASDGTITETFHLKDKIELKKDGEVIIDLLSEKELLQFIDKAQVESPPIIKHTKQELIKIFERANELLRKDGLREGVERFTEFSNILFIKMISEIEDQREQDGLDRRFEKRYCWDAFKNKTGEEILDHINQIILHKLVSTYNHSGDVFQNELKIKNPSTIKEIIDKLSNLNLLDLDSDVKGDAFEYFLKESVTVGNDLGEYFTPRHIVKLMVKLVDPRFGETVYDPCCGTGGFLIEAYKHLWNKCKHTKENVEFLQEHTIYGRELTGTAKIAKMNMILAGNGHTNIQQMDSLSAPLKEEYDVVLTNYPFSQQTDYANLYGFNTTDANIVFLKHIIDSLKHGGRAAIVTFQGVLYDKNENYKNIRKYILEHCEIEGIIKLHNYVFQPYTSVNTSIILLKKGKPTKNVFFFVVDEDGFEKTGSKKGRRPIQENDLKFLLEVWDLKPQTEKSWVVNIDSIKDNDYILDGQIYKPSVDIENNFSAKQLKDCIKLIKKKGEVGTIPYLEIGDINIIDKSYSLKRKPSVAGCKKAYEGNIVISTVRPTRGAVSFIEKELSVSSAFVVLESNELLLNKYLYFLLAFNKRFLAFLGDKEKGSTYPTVSETDILSFKIPTPTLAFQTHKVELMEKRENIIKSTSNSIRSLSTNLFDSYWFSNSSKIVPLSELIEENKIQNGLYKEREFYGKGTEIVRIDNFYDAKLTQKGFKKVSLSSQEKELYSLTKGDVLINRVNSEEYVGKCCVYNREDTATVFESNIMRFRVNQKFILPEYLTFYLSSLEGREQILKKIKRAVNQVSVNQEDIKSIQIPLKNIAEQKLIVDSINKNLQAIIDLKFIRDTNITLIEKEVENMY